MKNMRKFIKQNIKGFIVGLIVTGIGIVTASTIIPSNSVTYNNNSQNVTNVKEALDILLEKADNEAPTVSVSVSGKTATFTLKDDLGVIGYQVTTIAAEPTSWIDITSTTSIVKTWTASSAETYYVHVKDKFGKTNKVSFVIEKSAFSYPHYILQNGVVLDENLIETVNTKVYDSGNLKKDQNYNSGNVTLFTLKNADEYSKITIRYRYICYVDYGGASVRVGNKSYGNKGYISWYEDTQELTAKTGTASASANNGSSNTSWTARAGFQLLDIYVEP